MSVAKYTTVSTIQPLLYMLTNKTLAMKTSDSNTISLGKNAIKKDLASRYNSPEMKELLDIATYLDPRYKELPFYDTTTKVEIEEKLQHQLYHTQELLSSASTSTPSSSNETEVNESLEPPTKKKKGPMEQLLGTIFEETSTVDQSCDKIFRELSFYKSEAPAKLGSNPLEWWRKSEHLYPMMTELIKKYFSMVGTSVPSERLFSSAGNFISSKRNCLTPENADQLIFLFEISEIDTTVSDITIS